MFRRKIDASVRLQVGVRLSLNVFIVIITNKISEMIRNDWPTLDMAPMNPSHLNTTCGD